MYNYQQELAGHWWFNGRILDCHAGDPGPIPGQCKDRLFLNKVCGSCLREHSSNTYETADIILVKETSFENVFVDLHILSGPRSPLALDVLDQGCTILLLAIDHPANVSSNSNQTHLPLIFKIS